MQLEITKPSLLLDKNGELIRKGYATAPLLRYNRKNVKKKHRLKEWDYYLVYNRNHAVSLTVAKNLCFLFIGISIADLKDNKIISKNTVRIASKKFWLPRDSKKGNILYKDKLIRLSFRIEGNIRLLLLKKYNLKKDPVMDISLVLYKEPKDSMVIATPFEEDKRYFNYNRKIIGMRASGYVKYQNNNYGFSPLDSYAIIDWSRGVWPYKTTRYWSAGAGKIHGRIFGFNLGYGFGDDSYATENMLFYGGIASKLDSVTFNIPKNTDNEYDYLKPWIITSSDNRIEMVFIPIIDRSFTFPLFPFPLSIDRHHVFGKFTGRAVLDDGTVIYLKEFPGFAERSEYRW